MKDLPVGISTYRDIIEGNFIYVDKTKKIYELVRPKKGVYFLSRPRRFGKSLLISTLNEIFKGNKELFKGLYIYDTNYDWDEYPVVRISFGKGDFRRKESLVRHINNYITKIGISYNLEIKNDNNDDIGYDIRFQDLIEGLSEKYQKPVVILIDEYDKPILDVIDDIELAKYHQETLKAFYTIIKEEDAYIRFVLLTGVSKFSKTGVFSGLNNLEDITMNYKFSSMLGITDEELIQYFSPYIERLQERLDIEEREEILRQIKKWYNGYCFSHECERVYNPFSLFLLFKNEMFSNYWFETGTPTFLIKLIREKHFDVSMLEDLWTGEEAFSSYEIERLKVIPLLFQTGYLTIADYRKDRRLYRLYYPNLEVEESFTKVLLKDYSNIDKTLTDSYIYKLLDALITTDSEPDFPLFFDTLSVFFANIPYDIQIKREVYYQTIFYTVFLLLGLRIETEVKTNKGRIDVVIRDEKGGKLFIFEFKLIGRRGDIPPTEEGNAKDVSYAPSADDAIRQIRERGYIDRYRDRYKDIYLIGVIFDMDSRNIDKWKVERG